MRKYKEEWFEDNLTNASKNLFEADFGIAIFYIVIKIQEPRKFEE